MADENILKEDGGKVLIGTKLTEITPVGSSYFHQYQLNGEFYNVECTQAEYEALGLKGATAPSLPNGAVWVNSFAGIKFNTASGRIENNQFCAAGSLQAVKLPGKPVGYVTSEKVVNNELDPIEAVRLNTP